MQPGKLLESSQMFFKGFGIVSRLGGGALPVMPFSGMGFIRTLSSCFSGGINSQLIINQNSTLQLGGVRYKYTKKPSFKWAAQDPEGIIYPGFVYFPRFPDKEDPPIEPTKLFMVKRIRSLYGCPHWEKAWMRRMKLISRRDIAIVKNTPSWNARLYKIKHLIEITPITLPFGMPDVPENGFLKESGEFVSYNLLGQHEEGMKLEDAEKSIADYYSKNFDKNTMSKHIYRRWKSRYDTVH